MKHTDTQEIPALDAWKKVQKNRNNAVENAYNSIRRSINVAVSECKTSARYDSTWWKCDYTRVGFWSRKIVPVGTTKQLFDKLESDGFTVNISVYDFHSFINVSWDFSE